MPPELLGLLTLNINRIPLVEAFLVDAATTTPETNRWIQAKRMSIRVAGFDRIPAVPAQRTRLQRHGAMADSWSYLCRILRDS